MQVQAPLTNIGGYTLSFRTWTGGTSLRLRFHLPKSPVSSYRLYLQRPVHHRGEYTETTEYRSKWNSSETTKSSEKR